jgi:hypothetical protein
MAIEHRAAHRGIYVLGEFRLELGVGSPSQLSHLVEK